MEVIEFLKKILRKIWGSFSDLGMRSITESFYISLRSVILQDLKDGTFSNDHSRYSQPP